MYIHGDSLNLELRCDGMFVVEVNIDSNDITEVITVLDNAIENRIWLEDVDYSTDCYAYVTVDIIIPHVTLSYGQWALSMPEELAKEVLAIMRCYADWLVDPDRQTDEFIVEDKVGQ